MENSHHHHHHHRDRYHHHPSRVRLIKIYPPVPTTKMSRWRNRHNLYITPRTRARCANNLNSSCLFVCLSFRAFRSLHLISCKVWCDISKGKLLCKGKVLPLQAMQAQMGLGKLRLLDFLTPAQYGSRLSALRTGRLYPQGYSWYSFSLGAESTPGPWFGRKEICH